MNEIKFSQSQLQSLDHSYFFVFEASPFKIILKSKNTSHFWKIIPDGSKCIIYHSHQGNGNYHLQGKDEDLSSAIKRIRQHDKYQLTNRKKKITILIIFHVCIYVMRTIL